MKMVNALLNGDASQVVSDLCIPLCPALPMPFSRGCPITGVDLDEMARRTGHMASQLWKAEDGSSVDGHSISWLIIVRLSTRRLLSLLLMQVMVLTMNNTVR